MAKWTKEEIEKYKMLDTHTKMAIQYFMKLRSIKKRLDKIEDELNIWVQYIPEKDMEIYIELTYNLLKEEVP
jgi:hypothetical protein